MNNQIHTQNQSFTVLPQQIQLLKLFHLNTIGIQQRIQEELIENPLLEEVDADENDQIQSADETSVNDFKDPSEYQDDDIPDYKIEHNNYLSESDLPQHPIPEVLDFRKALKDQMALLTNAMQFSIAEYLIDSLNNDGILEQGISAIADDLSFRMSKVITENDIETVRFLLRQLEPSGIGCTSIKEYMLLQLRQKETNPRVQLAITLLEENFGDLERRNMEKIALHLNIEEDELREVLKLIGTCRRKPLAESTSPRHQETIVFDFVISQQADTLEVSLFKQRSSSLFISNSLSAMVSEGTCRDKSTFQYLKSKLNSAQWFVSAIKQRETTMLNVMKAIVKAQSEYFTDGDVRCLKPMILKDIADEVGVDISTVSRITCNKYADTPFGTILLKDLFSTGIENHQGETVSNRVIQQAIGDIVLHEDKRNPFTDQQLVAVLAEKGFNIARRTVAKYREQQQIPAMQIRSMGLAQK